MKTSFNKIKNGKKFKLNVKSILSFTKKNKTDAKCNQAMFSVKLADSHTIYT